MIVNFARSRELYDRALKVTPGASQTSSKAPGSVGPLGAFPLFLERGRGSHVTDVDGNHYIDWFNGNCAVTLGHGHDGVLTAVMRALQTGSLLSLPHPDETILAEQLVEIIPCAEQVRFVKTGSEACAAAVRLARMATKRNVILVAEGQYHGWHDWHCVTKPYHPGVPDELLGLVRMFRFGDLALDWTDVAAVMVEPALPHLPDASYLSALINEAHAHGALVVFDEMITGGRLALGGAQAFYGVTPDLATFGKAFGNGVPLAFVCGSADLMQHAWPISGTFSGDRLGIAAGLAVLQAYRDAFLEPIERMHTVGRLLIDGVNGICRRLGIVSVMGGHPCRPVWQGPADRLSTALLQQELAGHGVLAHPSGWNPSAAHEAEDIERTLRACEQALTALAGYLSSPDPSVYLRGEIMTPVYLPRAS